MQQHCITACPNLSITGRQVVYVFGGQAPGGELLNDLWQFDMPKRTWTELVPKQSAR